MIRTARPLVWSLATCLAACGAPSDRSSLADLASIGAALPPTPQNFALASDGDHKGNGGHAVVCFSDTLARDIVRRTLLQNLENGGNRDALASADLLKAIKSVQLLDLYEYQLPSGFPPKTKDIVQIDEKVSFSEALSTLVKQVKMKSDFGDRIELALSEMPLDNWRASPGVISINDSKQAVLLPDDCLLLQQAVRQGNFVYYDTRLFQLLDATNRLALVLHELVYRINSEAGQRDSRLARQITGLLMSKTEFSEMNPLSFHRLLTPLGDFAFPYPIEGYTVSVRSVTHYDATRTKPIRLIVQSPIGMDLGERKYLVMPPPGTMTYPSIELDETGRITALYGQAISRHSFGPLHYVNFSSAYVNFSPGTYLIQSLERPVAIPTISPSSIDAFIWHEKTYGSSVTHVQFDENERPSAIWTGVGNEIMIDGNLYRCEDGSRVEIFMMTGNVSALSVANNSPAQARTPLGLLSLSGVVQFYPNGHLMRAERASANSADAYLTLPKSDYRIYLKDQSLTWHPHGQLARIEFRLQPSTTPLFVTAKVKLHDVIAVEFDEVSGLAKQVQFGPAGRITNISDDDETTAGTFVGGREMNFDVTGQIPLTADSLAR